MVRLRRSIAFTLQVMPLTLGLATVQFLPPTMAPAAQAQTEVKRILTVTGSGVESIPTTLARVNLGIEIKGKTAQLVQSSVARRSNALMKMLKSRKVSELKTRGIRLNPTYDYSRNRQQLTGYVGTNTVSFQVQNADAGDILDAAVKAGATRIDGISFTATDEAIAAAEKEALKQATADARSQADAVLSALGFRAKEIVGIQINNSAAPSPVVYRELAPRAAAKASTPVVGGNQDIRGNVTLQIRY